MSYENPTPNTVFNNITPEKVFSSANNPYWASVNAVPLLMGFAIIPANEIVADVYDVRFSFGNTLATLTQASDPDAGQPIPVALAYSTNTDGGHFYIYRADNSYPPGVAVNVAYVIWKW